MAFRRLSPPEMGLTPFLCHRLAVSLLLLILTYGGDLFTPTAQMLNKMSTFWHSVQRWVTSSFSSTRLDILAIESCLPPLNLLLPNKRRMAALRALCSPPEINPVTAHLSPSVPTVSLFRHSPDSRLLLRGQSGSHLPLKWSQPRPPSMTRSHLPIHALAHSLLFLMGPAGNLPLPVTSPHLVDYIPPSPGQGRSYPQLKAACQARLLAEWGAIAPDPDPYPFPCSTKPHPLMRLPKFAAGRLHQMRAGKSYLAVHHSWFDKDPSPACPRCHSAPETLNHAILHCPDRGPARRPPPSGGLQPSPRRRGLDLHTSSPRPPSVSAHN